MEKFKDIKYCIGPMSKNIVDTIIKYCNDTDTKMMLIPSRRQIEYDGGYVNDWTTDQFCNYVKSKTNNVYLERDHAGPGQGKELDNGLLSLEEDCKYFDIIHIDPWKVHSDFEQGLASTIELIKYCYLKNDKLYFEVATEEAIRPFSVAELDTLMSRLKQELEPIIYERIIYLVIQSGTALKEGVNIGNYDNQRLKDMIALGKKYNIMTKEHNGDWLTDENIKDKFDEGLSALNIAPEFGMIETKQILFDIYDYIKPYIQERFYQLCLESGKWKKWVDDDFKPEDNKVKLIEICGHYVFSHPEFFNIKKCICAPVDYNICKTIYEKIESLHIIILN